MAQRQRKARRAAPRVAQGQRQARLAPQNDPDTAGVKPSPRQSVLQASRPTAHFDDPLLGYQAYRIEHVGVQAYLVALAAFQRGLRVTFHYELATKSARFDRLPIQGFRGELFSVSDGQTTHYFRRTQGDLTTREASARVEDKQHTKQCLIRHGIDVPDGLVVSQGTERATVQAFLERHAGQRFVLKPLNGTLGKGVQRDLTAEDVLRHLGADRDATLLLEECVSGDEYRVYVTGGRYVGALLRLPAQVTGDGQATLRQLVAAADARRARHPVYRHDAIQVDETLLMQQQLTLDTVPSQGQRVFLNTVPSTHHGGEALDWTQELPDSAREAAIQAQQALGLPNTGIDLIVAHAGTPAERVVILEANQNPYIALLSLPLEPGQKSQGNRIAESIIDHYFPDSIDNRRLTQAGFDFTQVCQQLQTGVAAEITLPVIGPDWVHQRLTLPVTQVQKDTVTRIRRAMFLYGIHAQVIKNAVGDMMIDVVAPRDRYQAFAKALRGTSAEPAKDREFGSSNGIV